MGRRKDWRKPPYYILLGMPRGGTSMMMEALIAGGMEAHYVDQTDVVKADRELGFKSNPHDVYEWFNLPNPLPKRLRGKVLKMFPWHMEDLKPGPFKVLLVTRKAEDIRASLDVSLGVAESRGKEPNPTFLHALKVIEENDLDQMMPLLGATLTHDPKVKDVVMVDYDQVCSNPLGVFKFIRDEGWPIDPDLAAAVPNKNWRSSGALHNPR